MKVHASEASEFNSNLKPLPRKKDKGNVDWMKCALDCGDPGDSSRDGSIVLIGGASLTHFRMKVAQSHARRDLLPSYWSHVAILHDRKKLQLYEVSLEPPGGFQAVPRSQGIRLGCLSTYDDPILFPNIALLHFTVSQDILQKPCETFDKSVEDLIRRLRRDRGTVDVLSPLWKWLGYVWGVEGHTNPLLQGVGAPSAILVETLFSMIGVELTPGLASQSSCPEAIWQAVKWWGDYYASEATLTEGAPSGYFCVDQPAAAVTSEDSGTKYDADESNDTTC